MIVIPLLAILATIAAPLIVEFIKNLSPRIVYSVTDALAIRLENPLRSIGAYDLRISNFSRRKADNLTLFLNAGNSDLRIEEHWVPVGLEFAPINENKGLRVPLQYLKPGDKVRLKVVAESYYVPASLDVSLASPETVRFKKVADAEEKRVFNPLAFFITLGVVGATLIFFLGQASSPLGDDETSQSRQLRPDSRQRIISAASDAGLPEFASLCASAPDLTYYEEADLAYAMAATSNQADKIERYRGLLSLSLSTEPNMAPESQANIFYSLGKMDLLLNDDPSAKGDFSAAITKARAIVESRSKTDKAVRAYLTDSGLL